MDQPEILLQTAISNKVGINNYYSSFSRDQEREADIFAIDRLNKLKISSEYLERSNSNLIYYSFLCAINLLNKGAGFSIFD